MGQDLGLFWMYFDLVIGVLVPWLSVLNPLVTMIFVERYRKYLSGLSCFGRLTRVGASGGGMMPHPASDDVVRTLRTNTVGTGRGAA